MSNQVPVVASRIPEAIRPILREVKAKLEAIYGDRLRGIVLYGSWARGEATDGSDIDLLILLDNVQNPVSELDEYSKEIHEIDLEYDVVISTLPVDADDFATGELPLYVCARGEGIALWGTSRMSEMRVKGKGNYATDSSISR